MLSLFYCVKNLEIITVNTCFLPICSVCESVRSLDHHAVLYTLVPACLTSQYFTSFFPFHKVFYRNQMFSCLVESYHIDKSYFI